MRNYEGIIRLQGIGEVQGIQAKNLQVGDMQIFNGGSLEKVEKIETTKTGKTIIATYERFNKFAKLVDGQWVGEYEYFTRKFRATSIVAVKELNPVQEVEQIAIESENEEVKEFESIESNLLDLTGVNFNDMSQLISLIGNWSELPENVQEAILKANNFYVYGQSLMLYIDYKAIAEAGMYVDDNKIVIESIGFGKDGLQWHRYEEEEQQEINNDFKIIIDGEGVRGKEEFNNFKSADYSINARCYQNYGYNKTWVTIIKDNKELTKVRFDLTTKDMLKGLKALLLEDAKRDLKQCNSRLETLKEKHWDIDAKQMIEYIAECEKFIKIIQAMNNEGNFKTQYNYTFWLRGQKIWEYTIDELQDDKYTETTLQILSGESKGYGEPIPNCKKEDIIVKIQKYDVAV